MTDAELLRGAVERLTGATDVFSGKADVLSDKVDGLSANVRRSRIATWVLAALCVGLLLVVGVVIGQARYSAGQAMCVRAWANAYAGRTNVLVPAAVARNNALDALVLSLQTHNRADFDAAYQLYVKASADYARVTADNPPPTAPQYTC